MLLYCVFFLLSLYKKKIYKNLYIITYCMINMSREVLFQQLKALSLLNISKSFQILNIPLFNLCNFELL